MCLFPFSPTSIFPWKLTPASYRTGTPRTWACPAWEEKGTAGKVSVTGRQMAQGSLAHVFLQLQLWVDMFTLQTTRRLQWVQTGIFNYLCGLFPINKILRKKENCLLACLLPGFLPSCGTQAEWLGKTPWLLWTQAMLTNEPRRWSGEGHRDDGMAWVLQHCLAYRRKSELQFMLGILAKCAVTNFASTLFDLL